MAMNDELERDRVRVSATRPVAYGAGEAARGAATSFLKNSTLRAGVGADTLTAPLRTAGGAVRDFAAGLTGASGPSAPNPAPFTRAAGGLVGAARRPVATAAPAAPAASLPRPATLIGGAPDFSGVTATVQRPVAQARPLIPAPAAAAALPAAAAVPGSSLQPGDVNTFTGSNGSTRPVPGLLNQPAQPIAARPQAVVTPPPNAAPNYAARGRQGGIIANPDKGTTADQIARAMGNSSLKGSPSARAAVAQAIMQDAGFANAERQSALETGDRADLQQLQAQAHANEGHARRDLDAQQFNVETMERGADREARKDEIRLARRPDVTVTSDGSMGIINQDGSFRPVTGADGQAIRAPQAPRQTGGLTQGERLKALTEMRAAAAGLGAPKEGSDERISYDARLQQLDRQIEEVMGGGATDPEIGLERDGFRYRGGDPADMTSWEKVN